MMLLLLLLLSSSCAIYHQAIQPPKMRGEIDLELREYKETSMGRHLAKISMQMLNYTASDLLESVVISPMGIFLMLSLYSTCAKSGITNNICRVLGGTERPEESVYYYASMAHNIKRLTDNYFNFGSKIFFDHMGHLSNNFTYFARLYETEVGDVNFLDEDHAHAEINKWVKQKTRGINKAIEGDIINSDINTALLDVIYFTGHWHVGFSLEHIKHHMFYTATEYLAKLDMMTLNAVLYFRESDILRAKLLELPYKNSFRMIIIYPFERDELPQVLSRLATEDYFYRELNELAPKSVDVLLPMFDLSTSIELKDALTKMGLSIIFENKTAGIRHSRSTVVSTVLQSAFIRVHAEGASAGAYTGVHEPADSSSEPDILCHVTHPFAFAVMHMDTIILLGDYQG